MADNLTTQTTVATIPTGSVIATDDVAGVHYQRVKLVDGTLEGTGAIGGDATNGLDVDVTRLPALVAGTANIGDVDVLTVPAPLSTTGGGVEATALRVTLASDSTGLVSVDDNAGSLTIDAVSLPLPTGAATLAGQTQPGVDIGDVTVNNAAGAAAVNVQDGGNSLTIDAASLPLPTGASTLAEQQTQTTALQLVDDSVHTDDAVRGKSLLMGAVLDDVAPTAITENQAGFLRMSSARRLLVDGSGVTQPVSGTVSVTEPVSVDDNAASLTVDAPVGTPVASRLSDGAAFLTTTGGRLSVDASGVAVPVTDNGVNLSVDWAGTVPPIGAGTEAAALRVTLATDSTGLVSVDDNGGSLTVDQGAAGTAWEVVGDVAHDVAAPTNPVLVGAQMETIADSAPGTRSGTDGDATKLATTDGALFVIPTGPQSWETTNLGLLTGATVKAAPGAGLSYYVTGMQFSIGAATASSIKLTISGGADIVGPHYLEAINGRGMALVFPTPLKVTAATALLATSTGSTTATLNVQGFTAPG